MVKYTVLKPREPYQPQAATKVEKLSFLTGLMNYARRIVVSVQDISATTSTLYTVPAGKIFYLTGADLYLIVTGGAGTADAFIYSTAVSNAILHHKGTTANSSLSVAVTYPTPLRFTNGERLVLEQVNGTATAGGAINGYEIDASLVPNFL